MTQPFRMICVSVLLRRSTWEKPKGLRAGKTYSKRDGEAFRHRLIQVVLSAVYLSSA